MPNIFRPSRGKRTLPVRTQMVGKASPPPFYKPDHRGEFWLDRDAQKRAQFRQRNAAPQPKP